jgi:iron complex outermembrane receptor protein
MRFFGRALLSVATLISSGSFLLPLAAAPQDAQGGTGLTRLSLEELGTIEVVSVTKAPEQIRRTPAAVYVLTQEDIRRSGATSIPELLRLVPGVAVARSNSGHWAIGIRGFGDQFSRSMLVLIDGRSVYTPLFAGVYWDVQDTLLEDIERIEVIRGPGGTVWGANAVNGVINIVTKHARDTQGMLAFVGGGNYDQAMAGFRYGAGNNRDFHYRFSGKFFTRGPDFHVDGNEFDDWRMGRFGFRADWERQNDTYTFQSDIYKGEVGERVAVGSFSPPEQLLLNANDDVVGGNILTRWRRELGGGSSMQTQVYYDRTGRNAPHYQETRDTFDIDFVHNFNALGRHSITWGASLRVSGSHFTQLFPTLTFTPEDRTDGLYMATVQDQMELVEGTLSLIVGTKLIDDPYSRFEVQPSARVLWTPTDTQTVWAGVTRAVRTPSRLDRELDLRGFAGTLPPLPPPFPNPAHVYVQVARNPDFDSERLTGYGAGLRSSLLRQFYVDLAWFHGVYDDLSSFGTSTTTIETDPIPHLLLSVPFANGIEGTTDGFEVAPQWSPADSWRLKGSYSYLNLSLKTKPGFSDVEGVIKTEGSSPRHQVVAQSTLDLPRDFELDKTYRYVSALPGRSIPAYSTMDVRLGWRFNRFEFSAVGQNLFQPHHPEFNSDPPPNVQVRRSIFGKISWTR